VLAVEGDGAQSLQRSPDPHLRHQLVACRRDEMPEIGERVFAPRPQCRHNKQPTHMAFAWRPQRVERAAQTCAAQLFSGMSSNVARMLKTSLTRISDAGSINVPLPTGTSIPRN